VPPARKKAAAKPPALTDADVSSLKSRVQAGEKPRVIVRSASAAVPAGTRGNVVRIGNPSEGEYIVVRLGKDEVPFAPNELALSARNGRASAPAPAKTSAAKRTGTTRNAAAKKSGARKASAPAARPKPATPRPAAAKAPVKAAPVKAAPVKAAPVKAAPAKTAAASRTAAKSAPAARKTTARAPGGGKARKALPPLVVTLRFNDDRWTVEAARGSRRLSKATSVRPGAVKAFADLVDDDVVRDVLSQTVESSRSVVEERAAALRAELEAAEEALRDYESRRR
jgi:hypothetical protein